MAHGGADLHDVCEIIKGRFYFATSRAVPASTPSRYYFSVDDELRYDNFYADFGPLNLAMLFKYCNIVNALLMDPANHHRELYHITRNDVQKRPNSAYLVGAYSVIYLGRTPEAAFRPIAHMAQSLHPFRDASYGTCTFKLTVLDCLRGIFQALLLGFLDFSTFDIAHYQHYERVENGDLNWVVPKKFLAFAGPHHESGHDNGYPIHSPESYFDFFRTYNVTDIVRLNQKLYDRDRFLLGGFRHHELYFVDGGIPPDGILTKFLELSEAAQGGVAVHCKAGLGRTGTLIACYMMKHYQMTASECIAWLRIVRPGSVIGPQQYYLQEKQPIMWRAGAALGARRLTEENERPLWVREAQAMLFREARITELDVSAPAQPEPLGGPIPLGGLLTAVNGLSLRSAPSVISQAALTEELLRATEVVQGRSQGDHLVALKARNAARTRSVTTGALHLDGTSLTRTRGSSSSTAVHVSNLLISQQAPLKTSKVKRPDHIPVSGEAVQVERLLNAF